ncbi:hypothetical protein O181_037202 [Austropuccinia psidii MF-1]|uniref:Uncharacterized protein n=1 Tax=Austropuccinia psidii MF-1 TaxID=1389203 RepID=A0A9Q3HAN4_9BASI|nr:hypothetical protein [Austropuccinia psidii MF-1]
MRIVIAHQIFHIILPRRVGLNGLVTGIPGGQPAAAVMPDRTCSIQLTGCNYKNADIGDTAIGLLLIIDHIDA